jgi:hypothetical protein
MLRVLRRLRQCMCDGFCVCFGGQIKDEVSSVIGVGEQIRVQVQLECLQPFHDSPALQLSFISVPGTGHAYPLRLPVMPCHFVEEVPMSTPDFEARWGGLAGAVSQRCRARSSVVFPTLSSLSLSLDLFLPACSSHCCLL